MTTADKRDRKHALLSLPFGNKRQKDDTGLIAPHLSDLREIATRCAITLGLAATGLSDTEAKLTAMSRTLNRTIGDIELDL